MARDPETIQREIDQARNNLAASLDQLVERTSPKRFVADGKRTVKDFFASPKGKAVIAVTGVVVVALVARRVNLAVKNHKDK